MRRLIDADALERDVMSLGEDSICNDCAYEFVNLIDEQPTVDAEPVRRGQWLTCDDGWGGVHYKCSGCGNEWFLEDGTPEENNMNYCPHCGAKMED